jgi:hypothetical protein
VDGEAETLLAPTGRTGKSVAVAAKFLRECRRHVADGKLDASLQQKIADLESLVRRGRFVHLERELCHLGEKYNKKGDFDAQELADELETLHATYKSNLAPSAPVASEEPMRLMVSETIEKE